MNTCSKFVLTLNTARYVIVDIFGSGLTVKLFADDVKMYAIINDVNDSVLLQEGLDGQIFGNCLFNYKNALFYILVGITLSITI